MQRYAVAASLILACAGQAQPSPDIADAVSLASTPVPRMQDGRPLTWFMQRHAKHLAIAKAGGVDVLFIGDSITEGWATAGRDTWMKEFAPLRSANLGVGGDRTENVLWRLMNGEVGDAMDPKVVILMVGTNNTGYRMDSPQAIAAGVRAIVSLLKAKCPQARILLLGIFPRSAAPDAPDRINNRAANQLIAKNADGERVKYLDIGPVFLGRDGSLSSDVMPDYLHLSAAGYALWARAILPEVKAALATRRR